LKENETINIRSYINEEERATNINHMLNRYAAMNEPHRSGFKE